MTTEQDQIVKRLLDTADIVNSRQREQHRQIADWKAACHRRAATKRRLWTLLYAAVLLGAGIAGGITVAGFALGWGTP